MPLGRTLTVNVPETCAQTSKPKRLVRLGARNVSATGRAIGLLDYCTAPRVLGEDINGIMAMRTAIASKSERVGDI
jgi:hypothetical protein